MKKKIYAVKHFVLRSSLEKERSAVATESPDLAPATIWNICLQRSSKDAHIRHNTQVRLSPMCAQICWKEISEFE